jgi:hypothetical protein
MLAASRCRNGTIPEVQAVVGARGRDAPAAVPEQEPGAAASTLPRLLLLGESDRRPQLRSGPSRTTAVSPKRWLPSTPLGR